MSTRSVVAIPTHNGDSWRGRYVHSDGYPTGRGPVLWELVQRDGWERVGQVICIEHAGWSSLSAAQPDISGVKVPKLKKGEYLDPFETETALYWAHRFSKANRGGLSDGRFDNVPGWGVAYNIASGQVSEDDWYTPEDVDDSDTAWVYVLSPVGLFVSTSDLKHPQLFPWNEEPDWQTYQDEVEGVLA